MLGNFSKDSVMQGLREMGFAGLGLPKATESWRLRTEWLRSQAPETLPDLAGQKLPDLSEAGLMAGLEGWLGPHLAGVRNKGDIQRIDLGSILRYGSKLGGGGGCQDLGWHF